MNARVHRLNRLLRVRATQHAIAEAEWMRACSNNRAAQAVVDEAAVLADNARAHLASSFSRMSDDGWGIASAEAQLADANTAIALRRLSETHASVAATLITEQAARQDRRQIETLHTDAKQCAARKAERLECARLDEITRTLRHRARSIAAQRPTEETLKRIH